MFWTLFLFFAGFYILIKGANWLVRGSSALARRFRISNFVIGLVVAGIGTSIPEFSVSFIANLFGEEGIALGTIVGSNTFNILFILGISSLLFPLRLKPEWVHRDLMWNVAAVFLAASFAIPLGNGIISRPEGVLMLILFSLWLYIVVRKSNNSAERDSEAPEPLRALAFPIAIGLILAGLLGVILGGKWVVDGAMFIARYFGASEGLVGLTIVGIGTSLPEFAVTFMAALKGYPGIAVGNIIGSNIFDFLMILGFAALAKPIVFPPHLFFDMIVTMLSAGVLYGFMFMGELYVLKRWQGLFLVFLYIIYITYLIGRG